ncbi:inositol 1,4,5-trisphosphate receptor-interacting protein-like 1 [Sphaerodactylus townsendi]|uniref:inositol 1,4,5-trisphosphate receptor-interacting protein-like 1 n=1 Tax=Sphaerodactylus townsendi TaxID=933632 RepID=UPI002025F2AD|nr:inositol 1,4,5-trisphosphate receptor-interacting protein-like 1 [Sphaerodactylus townsendi]
MVLGPLIFLAALALVHHPLMVSDPPDLATQIRLQDHEKRMKQEMDLLQTEFNQKGLGWNPLQTPQDWMTADQPINGESWDALPYVILLFFFVCCLYTLGKEPSDDSSTDTSSSTTNEDDEDTDVEPETYENSQKVLEDFYDCHIGLDTGDLTNMCEFVESFVNNLLEASKNALPYQNSLPLLDNCIGVDSAFEGWHTQESKPFTVLVPVVPPKGHLFHLETSDCEGTTSKHGHILVEMECMCKRERLLGDAVCFLHRPEEKLSEGKQGAFLMHILCTSSHLDVDKTIHWFQNLVGKAWKNIQHKYNLDLLPVPSNTSCKLKLPFRSGRTISVDIVLGVQQDSFVFLASQSAEMDHSAGTVWQRTFAVQELLFFKWVSQRAPEDSCHLKCMQILIILKEATESDKKTPVLTNYHYKTCLMHLLLLWPLSDWAPENIAQRLQDILLFMSDALQDKCLHHFLIGNISLPIKIPMPKTLRTAAPVNLFKHLAQDPNLHAEAMREFVAVVEQVRALMTDSEGQLHTGEECNPD